MKVAFVFVALLAFAAAEVAPEDFFDTQDVVEPELDLQEDSVIEPELDQEEDSVIDDLDEVTEDLEESNPETVDLEEDGDESVDEAEEPVEEAIEEAVEEGEESDEVADVEAQSELPQKHYRRAAATCAAKVAFYRANRIRGDRRRAKERAIIAHIRKLIDRLGRQKESAETDLEIANQFSLLETATEEQRKHAETHGRGGVLSLLKPILDKIAREAAHERRIEQAWVKKCDYYCHKAVKHREAALRRARSVERRAASEVRKYARLHNLAVGKYRGSVSAYKREQRVFAEVNKNRLHELALVKQLVAKLGQLERVKSDEEATADVQESAESQEGMGAEALQSEMVDSLKSLADSSSTPAFLEAVTELQRRHPKLKRVRWLLKKIHADILRDIRIARAKLAAARRAMEHNKRVMQTRARQVAAKRAHHRAAVRARKYHHRQLHRAHLACARISGYNGHLKFNKRGLGTRSDTGSSCKSILRARGGKARSGLYYITYRRIKARVYCDMTTAGGGWTVVAFAPCGGGAGYISKPNKKCRSLYQLRTGGGDWMVAKTHRAYSFPAADFARRSKEILFAQNDKDNQLKDAKKSSRAWYYRIPNPRVVNFAPGWSSSRGSCSRVTLVNAKTGAKKRAYTWNKALGTAWSDKYPTGVGATSSSSCKSVLGKGPQLTTDDTGGGNKGIYRGRWYWHRGWWMANTHSLAGSVMVMLR